jgi:hypothetical protein
MNQWEQEVAHKIEREVAKTVAAASPVEAKIEAKVEEEVTKVTAPARQDAVSLKDRLKATLAALETEAEDALKTLEEKL